MSTEERVKEHWEHIANMFDIRLTPREHERIIGILVNDFEKFAEYKIDEMEKVMKQLSTSGVR